MLPKNDLIKNLRAKEASLHTNLILIYLESMDFLDEMHTDSLFKLSKQLLELNELVITLLKLQKEQT